MDGAKFTKWDVGGGAKKEQNVDVCQNMDEPQKNYLPTPPIPPKKKPKLIKPDTWKLNILMSIT